MKHRNDGLRKRCDCVKRQWPKCGHPWHVNFHHAGKEHRFSLDVIARQRDEERPETKGDALAWRDRLRNEIRKGEFGAAMKPVETTLTFGDVCDRYLVDYAGRRESDGVVTWTGQHLRPAPAVQVEYQLRMARAIDVPAAGGSVRLEHKPITAVTKADLEATRSARRPHGIVGCNRLLARLRHLFNWAIGEGFTQASPFKRHGVSVVKLETKAEQPRERRLAPGEEEALLSAAGDHLRAVIAAALSTGCRVGELLSLQWSQVRVDDAGQFKWIELPGAKTKTHEARVLPIGPRLRAELVMRRHGPDGEPHALSAYVFGNDVGERVGSVKRAWERAVLVSHGLKPVYVKKKPGQLTAECRAALRSINLHVHDLRREFACRLLESSADLHDVRDFLGHANVTTTSRYLASSPVRLAKAHARLEGYADEKTSTIRTPFAHEPKTEDPATTDDAPKLLN